MDTIVLNICCPYKNDIDDFELSFTYNKQKEHEFYSAKCNICDKNCDFKTWDIKPHTEKKIEILRVYLNAWFPKLLSINNVLYFETFSGPGRYVNNSLGSPTTALHSYINFKDRDHLKGKATFIFVEKAPEILNMLRSEEMRIKKEHPDITINICEGNYLDYVDLLIDKYLEKLPPTFVFIDPFGLSTIPFKQLDKILNKRSCEAMIHLMYQYINRFITDKVIDNKLKELFGSIEVVEQIKKEQIFLQSPEDRFNLIKNKYIECLKLNTGIRYVLPFVLRDNNNSRFSILFFASNHIAGLKEMKHAMWKVDPTGNFEFSDYEEYKRNLPEIKEENLQISLFNVNEFKPNPEDEKKLLLKKLKEHIYDHFKGNSNVSFSQIEKFVLEETIYLDTHIIEHALKPLITEGLLEKIHESKINYKNANYNFC